MRKTVLVMLALALTGTLSFAGGLVTNSNQSASWIRMLSRNASTEIDGIYYNPAGVASLSDGLHLSFSNQMVRQDYTITSSYPTLNNGEYTGEVRVPFLPNLYAGYKTGNWAFSIGLEIVGGGGTLEYPRGLPSLEQDVSALPILISGMGIPTSSYSVNQFFDGSSIYYGIQFGAAYKVNEMISASIGLRYVYAQNTYEGYLKNVMINPQHPAINPDGGMMSAAAFFTAIGQNEYAEQVSDKNVDASQTASGIAPIIGLNITPTENLNIGIRWEGLTKLEFENETKVDGSGMFPDGHTFRKDMPMVLGLGAQYQITEKLRSQLSYTLYFDKGADYDGREDLIDNNFFELSLGAEYDINELITVSAGYLLAKSGVGENYNNDLNYSLTSSTVGLGARFNLSEKLKLDVGGLKIFYQDASQDHAAMVDGGGNVVAPPYTMDYSRDGFIVSVGVNYSF